ncbi:hypothetical protein FRC04_008620 [Tulasnella sp. 424]|nr:hypothetical protein FRC04_008620 [Tulasnella sp. 424]KAG8970750.1 hypothetical protein FRC05_011701 [Tulasnella sp. 425]
MRFITIIVLVLAYGPAIFDLAVTGRRVHRPTQTSTTDWALAQFYTSHIGKSSLAVPPTGLAGAVITSDHNNQDSAVSIWTTVHVTSRRALANVGSFVNSFNHPRLDRQWRYIRGWWQFNSGRVIDEGLTVCIDFLPFLAVILTIWKKRATEELARFVGRQLLGAPTTCTGVVTVFEELRSGQEVPGAATVSSDTVSVSNAHGSGPKGPNSRRIIVDTLLVFLGGFVVIHYEAVDDRAFWTITIILNPEPSSSSAVARRTDNIYRVVYKRTVTLPTRGLIEAGPPVVRRGGEPLPSHEPVARPNVSPRRRPGSTSSFFTTIHSLEGVLVMACSSTGKGLHWSIQFHPFQHYHISHHTNNNHDKEELVQADAGIPLPDSPELHGLDRSTRSLDLYQYIAGLSHQFLSHRAMLVRPLLPEEVNVIRAELRPRLRNLGERARERRGLEESIQGTALGIEPEAQVVMAPSVDSDGNEGDEAEEEETEGNDLVEPALVPLPPSRPASPQAKDLAEEELLRADFFPLADSRPNSPKPQALDRSARRSDLYQYITALSRQYLNLRATLVRPLLPGEARAVRAELRPRLGSLEERACERRGLPTFTSVTATELEGQVNEQEIVEQGQEEEVGGQIHEVEVDGQVHEEEADGQVNDEEVGGQVNDEEADLSRNRKKPHRGGKKTRTRKQKHQTNKEEEADPAREH